MLIRLPRAIMLNHQFRGVRKPARSYEHARLEFLDAQNCGLRLHDYTRDGLLDVPFGDQSACRWVVLVEPVHRDEHDVGQAERLEELEPVLAKD